MVDVTQKNFDDITAELQTELPQTLFFSIDFEFSGLQSNRCSKISLFDSPEQRYHILRKCCHDFTPLQFGLTLYKYDRSRRVYESKTYNFYLFPSDYKCIRRQILFESSAAEFLTSHDFDINKCFAGGVSYLNEDEIEKIKTEESYHPQEIVLSNVKQDFLERKLEQIGSWCGEANFGETFRVDCHSWGTRTALEYEVTQRFKDVICVPGDSDCVLLLRKVSSCDKLNHSQNMEHSEERQKRDAIGCGFIFKLLSSSKRILVGHNLLRDLLFLYEKFHKPLPESYTEFKRNLHKLFPRIFDTRHIINKLRVELRNHPEYNEWFISSSLGMLYSELHSEENRRLLYQPTVTTNTSAITGGHTEHNAGYDSYLAGTVFIRLGHFYATFKFHSTTVKPFHFNDYIRDFAVFQNNLNLIRCSVTHIDLMGEDPKSIRPQWLRVRTRDRSNVDVNHVAHVLSAFGRVDVREDGKTSCLVAVPSVGVSAGLIVAMETHSKYMVKRYTEGWSLIPSASLSKVITGLEMSIPIACAGFVFFYRCQIYKFFKRLF